MSLRFAARRRATSAAAAAPNNSTIGGAGTGVGSPDELLVLPPELDEDDEELLLDEEDDELVLPVEPQLLLPPVAPDEVAPLDVLLLDEEDELDDELLEPPELP
ncbi:MAG TPA: hypothetical protein VJ811_04725 [Sphingopyxis sp.]|nr:hypothetical protein [Sphingopyxis sp.]